MATNKPRTQAVPMAQPTQLRAAALSTEGYRAVGNTQLAESKTSQALSTLNRIVPEAATMAKSELDRVAEEDATRQEARALHGLRPDDDATVAGLEAHRMVDVRNTTNLYVEQINTEASTFTGTPEEWEDRVIDIQSELLDNVGNDEATMKVTGAIFREQLPKSSLIKFRADQARDQNRKKQTTISSVRDAARPTFTDEDFVKNIKTTRQEAVKMGMTDSAWTAAFVDAAVQNAANDDVRLIDYAKANGMYEQFPALQVASKQANKRIDQKDQGRQAVMKEELIGELSKSEMLGFTEFAIKAAAQKDKAGNPIWTEEAIRAAWRKDNKKKDKKFTASELYSSTLSNPDILGTSLDPKMITDISKYPVDTQQAVVEMYREDFETSMARAREDFKDDPEKGQQVVRSLRNDFAAWLGRTGLKNEEWIKQFDNLGSMSLIEMQDMDANEKGELNPSLLRTMSLAGDLSENPVTLKDHAGDYNAQLALAFRRNHETGNYTQKQSLIMAKKQIDAPKRALRGETLKKFNKLSEAAISETFSNWFSGDIPLEQSKALANRHSERTKQLYNLSGDMELSAKQAAAEIKAKSYQLPNGTVIPQKMEWLMSKMGVTNVKRLNSILTKLPHALAGLSASDNYSGYTVNTPTAPEDWVPHYDDDGLVIYTDEFGAPVGEALTLHEAAGMSIFVMNKLLEQQEATVTARRKAYNELEAKKRTGSGLANLLVPSSKETKHSGLAGLVEESYTEVGGKSPAVKLDEDRAKASKASASAGKGTSKESGKDLLDVLFPKDQDYRKKL